MYFLSTFLFSFNPNAWTLSSWIDIFITLILILASAVISAFETAFFSLKPIDIEEIKKQETLADKRLTHLKQVPEKTLATLLVSNTTINIAIVILSSILISSFFDFSDLSWLNFLVQTIFITFLLLLFCEIIPKIYARRYALTISRRISGLIQTLFTLLSPVTWFLLIIGRVIDRKVHGFSNNHLSMDDLSLALELSTSQQKENDKEILEGIIRFGSKRTDEVMTARPDIAAINIKSTFNEVKNQIVELGYSRIPVYQENIDHIKGILYNKDLLPHLDKGDGFKWQTLLRPAYFVPETKKIDDLLREFQTSKNHIAIVVDEYGGTSGIVTLEDILEEVVGEIDDEYDEQKPLYHQLDKNSYDFDAKISLSDFFKITGIDTSSFEEITAEVESLAGLVLELKGDFPKMNEKIVFGRFIFEILEMTKRRIIKVRFSIQPNQPVNITN
ncbi:MAG: gliding motility-associated protein GldE [Microbacter sp.]